MVENIIDIPAHYITLVILTAVCYIIILFVKKFIFSIYKRTHSASRDRYLYNKNLNIVCNIIMIICAMILWEQYLKSFITFVSFFSAGVAIAVREVILNYVCGLYITIKKPFELEDRIEIDDLKGDVVNIKLSNFEILEIGDRVNGEQSTGRIVHIPNSIIFKYPLKNYVKAFKYIWNEVTVKIDLDSNIIKTKNILYKIIKKNSVVKEIPAKMEKQVTNASSDYRIYFNNLEPIIYTKVVDKHIELNLRYLVHPKKSRNVEDLIWTDILKEYKKGNIKLCKE